MGSQSLRKMTVALAGNPNVGKSTLFNLLTGLRQHTGNWPGKTVGVAQGTHRTQKAEFTFVDLPGTYALDGKTEDEQIAAAYLESGAADCTVVVCDGSCLERNLILALQILERTDRVILCVNMMDEARSRGIRIDGGRLSRMLGVEVVFISAGKKQGIDELLERILMDALPTVKHDYPDPVAAAEEIASQCVTGPGREEDWRRILDKILVSRRRGIPIMLLLLLGIVWLTVKGANYPSMLLETLFDWGYEKLMVLFASAPDWVRGMLVEGMYATAARVIAVMLPPMAIFFPLFTLLEDIGYLPRLAFLLDHGMARCGGCGKQALTLCMGLGCNAVGVTGCRIIDSPRERLAAILTNAFVPCNGRFPTLLLLGSIFFPGSSGALVVAACVALGAAGAMTASAFLTKTVLRSQKSTFVMELPPLRRPRLGQILVRSLLDRTLFVAGRALAVAAPAGAVLWWLSYLNLLDPLWGFLDPAAALLGLNGIILLAFILSIPANELLIPVILMVLTGSGSLQSASALGSEWLLQAGWGWQTAVCTMVFTLFHWPCATTLMTIFHETKSVKKTAAAFLLPTAVGVCLCMMLNLIFQDLCR